MVLVTGMTIGTLFTLFVVPVFYSLIAAERRQSTISDESEEIEEEEEDLLMAGVKG